MFVHPGAFLKVVYFQISHHHVEIVPSEHVQGIRGLHVHRRVCGPGRETVLRVREPVPLISVHVEIVQAAGLAVVAPSAHALVVFAVTSPLRSPAVVRAQFLRTVEPAPVFAHATVVIANTVI